MKYLLDELLPRILPQGVEFQTIPHNGKRALERSIPRKLRGWNEPGDVRFVILHDQDTRDCRELKRSLLSLCRDAGRSVLVRIACQEMEAWYFGDIEALAQAYDRPKLLKLSAQKRFRVPDDIPFPKETLYQLIPEHKNQQIAGAKRIAPYMEVGRNTSESFRQFVDGVRRLSEEAT